MNTQKPLCKYGNKCYRKNPQHLEQYSHGSSDDDSESQVRRNPAKTLGADVSTIAVVVKSEVVDFCCGVISEDRVVHRIMCKNVFV